MATTPEVIILLRILAAHLLADFFLQRRSWIAGKKSGVTSPYLYYHIAIVGALTYIMLADWTGWQLPLFIMITHFIIDWWKSTKNGSARYFIIDQVLHFLMLIIGWGWYAEVDLFNELIVFWTAVNSSAFWIILCSYLIILHPIGFLIEKLTARWGEELISPSPKSHGLAKAGTWIGYLERFIILTFLLVGQYSAIGFLIAAKSIFRFSGKVTDEQDRKHTEYILIGTLLSFTLAILVGIIAVGLMN